MMKFIKQLDKANNIEQSKIKTYENVVFINNFSSFLQALYIENLLRENSHAVLEQEGWCWGDNRETKGIKLITSEHPMLQKKSLLPMTISISGVSSACEVFESILCRYATFGKINEVSEKNIKLSFQYHDILNPVFWEKDKLKKTVREKLLEIANEFYETLKMPKLEIEDIILTGSNANYNWTPQSDLDLHLVVDFKKAKKHYGSLIEEYFQAKKKIWNDFHDIQISNHKVEVYVQDTDEKHLSTGIYSLLKDEWIVKPKQEPPTINSLAVKQKTIEIMKEIDEIVKSCNKAEVVEKIVERLRRMRQAGLSKEGEFSVENLVFKTLRNNGYLEKLVQCKKKAFDRALSIEEEEWRVLQ